MREAFLAPGHARKHKGIERKVRRLFLGRDLPENEIETQAVTQMHLMLETGIQWLVDHPDANLSIAFVHIDRYIGGIDDGVKRGFVQCTPDGLSFLQALWPWSDPHIPTVTMCKVVFDEITRSRSK